MALTNSQYDTIMREYSRRQSRNRTELELHRQEAYRKLPRLPQIDEEVARLSAEKARALLSGRSDTTSDLKTAVEKLSRERTAVLRSGGYPGDYLEEPCTCPLCRDTGYVGNKKCVCFKKAEIELLYTQSNLKEILKKENFDSYTYEWYSDTDPDSTTGLTSRELAKKACRTAKSFVKNFDTRFQNLFLYGNTGVGKTFLSHCIARDLLESGHCVIYFSAFDLFDLLARSAFSHKEEAWEGEDLIYDCDLLIIDDLGTELANSFVASQLFLCINERIMREKATIISTNLTLQKVSDTYSERTFSRIASNYQMIKLTGEDIRIKKKIHAGGQRRKDS